MDEEEPRRGMTPARWAAVACLVAFAGVPVLSLLITRGSADDPSTLRQLFLALLVILVVAGVIVVVARRVGQDRARAQGGLDDWFP